MGGGSMELDQQIGQHGDDLRADGDAQREPKAQKAEAESNPGQPDRLLTLVEALAFLRISRSTFYRLQHKGKFNYGDKLGGQWRFSRAELDQAGRASAQLALAR